MWSQFCVRGKRVGVMYSPPPHTVVFQFLIQSGLPHITHKGGTSQNMWSSLVGELVKCVLFTSCEGQQNTFHASCFEAWKPDHSSWKCAIPCLQPQVEPSYLNPPVKIWNDPCCGRARGIKAWILSSQQSTLHRRQEGSPTWHFLRDSCSFHPYISPDNAQEVLYSFSVLGGASQFLYSYLKIWLLSWF